MYNKFMRVGDIRGELSRFEAEAKFYFYINLIRNVILIALALFLINLFFN